MKAKSAKYRKRKRATHNPAAKRIMTCQRDHRGCRYPRKTLTGGFTDALDERIRAESIRWRVSMRFVIAVACGDFFGIDHERY